MKEARGVKRRRHVWQLICLELLVFFFYTNEEKGFILKCLPISPYMYASSCFQPTALASIAAHSHRIRMCRHRRPLWSVEEDY